MEDHLKNYKGWDKKFSKFAILYFYKIGGTLGGGPGVLLKKLKYKIAFFV